MFFKPMGSSRTVAIDWLEIVTADSGPEKIFGDTTSGGNRPSGGVAPWWTMTINGKPSDQDIADFLNFSRGDVIRVTHGGSGGMLMCADCDIKEIRGALPYALYQTNPDPYFDYTFQYARSLKTVPAELFVNVNGMSCDFTYTFNGCGIETVPTGLFANLDLPKVNFFRLFYDAYWLNSIDINEFARFKNIKSLNGMFSGCDIGSAPIHLRFTATDVSESNGFQYFASRVPEGRVTVYCPKGSNFAKRMKADNPNVTVVEE